MPTPLPDVNVSFLPSGSLARHLVWRLLPPILGLAMLDLFLTWVVTHKLEVAGWDLQDMFWLLLLGQVALIGSLAWVVVQGVRTGMRAVNYVSAEIALRSADDLSHVCVNSLPSELGPMLRHTNELLNRLSDAMAAQRRFVGHAAHQLKTPLAGLKLESELMLAQDLTPELQERAQRIKGATDRMIRLGQQLLILARVDPQTRPQDHFVKLDLCDWLRQSGARWWHIARDAKIDLVLDAPLTETWVEGDPILLDELLGNLVDNALRYAKGATFVRLHISQTPPTLAVEDNGSGISAQEQGRVFEAFYRSPQSQIGGSGLGLAIVREIARAHGAWWNLVSRPQFAGTRLTVVFPGQRVGAQLNRLDQFNVVR